MKFDTVIWDWNGTLLDDFSLCLATVNGMLLRRGLAPLTQDGYRRIFRFPIESYYRDAGFDFTKEPFSVLAREYMDIYQPQSYSCPLQRGAREALSAIRAAGIRQYLLSASLTEYLDKQIDVCRVREYFDGIYGIDNIHAGSKAAAARRVPVRGRALFVGDTPHDTEAADILGAECVLLSCGHKGAHLTGTVLPGPWAIPEYIGLSE